MKDDLDIAKTAYNNGNHIASEEQTTLIKTSPTESHSEEVEANLNLPYKGLNLYTEADTSIFFGRRKDTQNVVNNLLAWRLTILYGKSGVGKSSVLRAGVTHTLNEEARQNIADYGVPKLAVVIFPSLDGRFCWKDAPLARLKKHIQETITQSGWDVQPPEPEWSLLDTLKHWTDVLGGEMGGGELYLILDQFEEYFLYHPQEKGEGTFFTEFSRAVNSSHLQVNFLISIREDSIADIDRFQAQIPNLFEHRLHITHLDGQSAKEAIIKPIEYYNQKNATAIAIEPELVDAVIDEVQVGRVFFGESKIREGTSEFKPLSEMQIETPYLQLVMERIWKEELEQGSHLLQLKTFKALGQVDQIVKDHFNDRMQLLTEEKRKIAVNVFQYLVTSSGAKYAYAVVDLSEDTGIDQTCLKQLLEDLSSGKQRILRPVGPARPERPETQRYEIFHDILASPIREWIQEQKLQDQIKAEQARLKAKQEQQNTIKRQRTTRAFTILVGLAGVTAFWGWQQNQFNQQLNFRNTLNSLSLTQRDAQSRFHESAEIESLLTMLPLLQQNSKSNSYSLDPGYVTTLTSSQATLDTILHQIREQNRWQATTNLIHSSSFTPDGKAFAIGSADGSIQVWSVEGSPTLRCEDRSSKAVIHSVSVSSDHQYLTAALGNGAVRLWALKDCVPGQKFQPIQELQVGGVVSSVSFHPRNPRLLLTGSNNGSVSLWIIQNEKPGKKILLEPSNNPVSSVQFSPGGDKLAIGFEQGEVELWNLQGDLQTTLSVPKFKAHDRSVTNLSFSPDGQILVTGSEDTTVKRWSLQENSTPTGTVISKFERPVSGMNFLADGKSLLSSSLEGTVRWMTVDGETIHTFSHGSSVWSISINPQQPQLLTTEGIIVRLWDLGPRDLPGFRVSPNNPIRDVAWSPNSQLRGVAWSPDGQQVATVAEGLSVANLWTLKGSPIQEFKGHQGPVNDISFNPNGELIATASSDGTARLWNRQGKTLQEFKGHQGAVLAVQFSSDGKQLATASEDNTVRLWDMQGNTLQEFKGHQAPVNDVSFSPDGQQIATASSDGTARLWNLQGKTLQEFKSEGDQQPVLSVDISRDGNHVVTGSLDTVQLWNLQGQLLAQLPIEGGIRSVRFSPNSQHLGIALDSGSVLLATAAGELQGLITSNNGIPARSLSFSPDSQRLIVGLGDGRVTNWPVQTISLSDQISQACNWLKNYLPIHPEVKQRLSTSGDVCPQS